MSNQIYTPAQQAMIDLWNLHTEAEFVLKDANAAIATMTDCPVLTHVPVATGATGRENLRKFYAEIFIPQSPPDFEIQLLSRSVSEDRIIDEFIVRLTHTVRMDWFAPGIEPTGRKIVLPHVGIVAFENGLMASEHIYWDHDSLLVQLGLLDPQKYPALGDAQANRLLDPQAVSNQLIDRL